MRTCKETLAEFLSAVELLITAAATWVLSFLKDNTCCRTLLT